MVEFRNVPHFDTQNLAVDGNQARTREDPVVFEHNAGDAMLPFRYRRRKVDHSLALVWHQMCRVYLVCELMDIFGEAF